jgi:hypothetical protein
MSVCIIALAEYSGSWEIIKEEMAKPVNAITRCRCFSTVTVQAMNVTMPNSEFVLSNEVSTRTR